MGQVGLGLWGGGRGGTLVYSLRSAPFQGLVLDPTDGLHLVGVSLGAELVVVSVFALVSVSLQDVLVTTVTGELVGHPAVGGRERNEGGMRSELLKCISKKTKKVWNIAVMLKRVNFE